MHISCQSSCIYKVNCLKPQQQQARKRKRRKCFTNGCNGCIVLPFKSKCGVVPVVFVEFVEDVSGQSLPGLSGQALRLQRVLFLQSAQDVHPRNNIFLSRQRHHLTRQEGTFHRGKHVRAVQTHACHESSHGRLSPPLPKLRGFIHVDQKLTPQQNAKS